MKIPLPRCSMYGTFTYIYPKNCPNVGKYPIHGASGLCFILCPHEMPSHGNKSDLATKFWRIQQTYLGDSATHYIAFTGYTQTIIYNTHIYICMYVSVCIHKNTTNSPTLIFSPWKNPWIFDFTPPMKSHYTSQYIPIAHTLLNFHAYPMNIPWCSIRYPFKMPWEIIMFSMFFPWNALKPPWFPCFWVTLAPQTAWMMVEHPELGQLMRRARKRKAWKSCGWIVVQCSLAM